MPRAILIMDIALALAPTLCVGAVSGTLCVLCQSRNKPTGLSG